jgi:hypothetical protein
MSLFESASICITPNAYKAGTLYAIKGADLTVTRATSATRVNANGLIETVGANVPRLDYTNGSCPSILVEPQRTNLVFPSATATTQTRTVTAVAHTLSFYGTGSVTLSGVATGTLNGTDANNRVTLTFTPTAGSLNLTVSGTVTDWQLEAGSNATSYIPTVASAVTRNADVITKTEISDLIGQTEGTVLCNINLTKLSEAKALFVIDNGTTNEYILLIRVSSNIFRLRVKNTSGAAVTIIDSIVINDSICRIGIAYKNGDYAMYVNGTLRGTSTNSTNFPTTALSQFVLSNASYGTLNDSYNLVALWKTRFSNEQLETLTTI